MVEYTTIKHNLNRQFDAHNYTWIWNESSILTLRVKIWLFYKARKWKVWWEEVSNKWKWQYFFRRDVAAAGPAARNWRKKGYTFNFWKWLGLSTIAAGCTRIQTSLINALLLHLFTIYFSIFSFFLEHFNELARFLKKGVLNRLHSTCF